MFGHQPRVGCEGRGGDPQAGEQAGGLRGRAHRREAIGEATRVWGGPVAPLALPTVIKLDELEGEHAGRALLPELPDRVEHERLAHLRPVAACMHTRTARPKSLVRV